MALGLHGYTCARSTDTDILERDLRRSPSVAGGEVERTVLWDKPSASSAYAGAMEKAKADILIFAHCDDYFPEGWFERLRWEAERRGAVSRTGTTSGHTNTWFGSRGGACRSALRAARSRPTCSCCPCAA